MYITRLASDEIFSPSNKIQREVGWAKDLSAPRYCTSRHPWVTVFAILSTFLLHQNRAS